MPEGPEVHTIVDHLGPQITGKHLLSIGWDDKSKYRDGLDLYDELSRFLPIKIESLICKGKQIFIKLVNRYTVNGISYEGVFYLNCTLGMEGRFIWEPETHSNLWIELGDLNECNNVKLVIVDKTLYFDDSRHFGNITILTELDYADKIKAIGPDLLTDEITREEWLSKAHNKRISKKQICDYLMEQKYFSGIGNYLKAEILYAARIKPDRSMANLSEDDLMTILKCAQNKIRESYQSNGLTIRSYIAPDGSTGTFERVVYGKETDPYGNKIVQTVFKDKRTTHWVPGVQI